MTFQNTKEIKYTDDIIAQKRATRAIHVGLSIRSPGYNIYVAGYEGTGKTSVIRAFLEKWSEDSNTPNDWIYVYDFEKKDSPKAICLVAGEGHKFAKFMDDAISELRKEIPKAFQSEDYERSVNSIVSANTENQAKKFKELERTARKMDFLVKSSSLGIETIPAINGRAVSDKEYNKISEKDRKKIEAKRSLLEPKVLNFARNIRELELKTKQNLSKLEKNIGEKVVDRVLDNLLWVYKKTKPVVDYLNQVREYILDHISDFLETEDSSVQDGESSSTHERRDLFRKYKINLFIDNRNQKTAPVIIETNPTYYNLFGKIEKTIEHGVHFSDFTMVQAGSIHRANGGYLVLNAHDVLKMPFAWDKLKRVLRNRLGYIEEVEEPLSMLATSSLLRPDAIPLDLKVILIGSDEVYHLLFDLDEDFAKIFKIKANFDYQMSKNKTNVKSYVSFIASRCHKEKLLHFDRSGVTAVIEYGSRRVEDQGKLTSQFSEIKDLIIEADFIAREEGESSIARKHVEKAVEEKIQRRDLLERYLMEIVVKQDIIVSLSGAKVGIVNGLSVYSMSDYSFGKISRLTCTVSGNDRGILNIERASKLSGNIHDKGVFILSGFLNSLLAKHKPFGYSASLCFEQSYGPIDGDSATSAELTALVSALSGIPILQNLAITGSLNQVGEVQPVGGINEKIEGFYKTCLLIGKEKHYSVIIPHQNKNQLMLNRETREAVRSGHLRIYPTKHFWEVFELATGVSFGAKTGHEKKFEKGSALSIILQKRQEPSKEGVGEASSSGGAAGVLKKGKS
ncbi:MAG: AAA family ATPase [Oligoflexales bacterium]|nr:AAA family ATPase [Oligoflexales bacterium]